MLPLFADVTDFFMSSDSVGLATFAEGGSGLALSLMLSLKPLSYEKNKSITNKS